RLDPQVPFWPSGITKVYTQRPADWGARRPNGRNAASAPFGAVCAIAATPFYRRKTSNVLAIVEDVPVTGCPPLIGRWRLRNAPTSGDRRLADLPGRWHTSRKRLRGDHAAAGVAGLRHFPQRDFAGPIKRQQRKSAPVSE